MAKRILRRSGWRFIVILGGVAWGLVGRDAAAISLPNAGVNLSSYSYYTRAIPFVEVSRMGSQWFSVQPNGTLNADRVIPLNSTDYPTSLAADEWARALIFTHDGEVYPTGDYVLRWSGQGNLQLSSPSGAGVTVVSSLPNQTVYRVNQTHPSGLYLSITQTDTADPVRDISLFAPFPSATGVINPKYKADLTNYGVLRYMDWNRTNNSTVTSWSDRMTPDHFFWGGERGVPYEAQVAMSNETKQDMWLTVPHLADDECVRNLAKLVKDRLSPDLRVWVEYSNEVWNSRFQQSTYANDVLAPRYGVANGRQAYGRRSAEIFDIFSEEIADPARLVRVIAGQNANPWVLDQSLIGATVNGVLNADVAAVAPYFSVDIDQLYQRHLAGSVDLEDVFTELQAKIDATIVLSVANREKAAARGLPLVAYEGGQHLVARPGEQHNNVSFVELLRQINRDDRMGEMYRYMLDRWYAAEGSTFVFYSDTARSNKWGYWGLKESYLDDNAPKFQAVQEYLQQLKHNAPDLNQDGAIDQSDYDMWRSSFGLRSDTGDANADTFVDSEDFVILRMQAKVVANGKYDQWRESFGSPDDLESDWSSNGVVDDADYIVWRMYGDRFASAPSAVAAAQAVPEPSSWTLIASAFTLGLLHHPRGH